MTLTATVVTAVYILWRRAPGAIWAEPRAYREGEHRGAPFAQWVLGLRWVAALFVAMAVVATVGALTVPPSCPVSVEVYPFPELSLDFFEVQLTDGGPGDSDNAIDGACTFALTACTNAAVGACPATPLDAPPTAVAALLSARSPCNSMSTKIVSPAVLAAVPLAIVTAPPPASSTREPPLGAMRMPK